MVLGTTGGKILTPILITANSRLFWTTLYIHISWFSYWEHFQVESSYILQQCQPQLGLLPSCNTCLWCICIHFHIYFSQLMKWLHWWCHSQYWEYSVFYTQLYIWLKDTGPICIQATETKHHRAFPVRYSHTHKKTVESPQARYSDLLSSVTDVDSLKKYFIACVWAQVWQVINVGGQSYDHASYSTAKGAPEETPTTSYQQTATQPQQSQNQGGTNPARHSGHLLSSIMNVDSLRR